MLSLSSLLSSVSILVRQALIIFPDINQFSCYSNGKMPKENNKGGRVILLTVSEGIGP